MPAERTLLLLNRPAEREQALQQFLRDVHNRESATYHKWIAPEEFGRRFGPADGDINAAVGWLQSKGFAVARVAKSKQFIEFSGTVGQLRAALHTDIHRFEVNGEMHYANSSEVSIPAALAPLVRGVSALNNFRAKPYVKMAGPALYSRTTKKATPEWTITNPFGTPNPYAYPVAPEDYATQYDLTPLYQAGVNGTGETIGIINESNIDLSLVSAYQQMFGLPNNPTQLVIDGNDPGTLNYVDVEAYLDVEVSGALAPNATINLYISNGSDFQDPLALAAIRAIEDNEASILSVSFGECEQFLRTSGNQFWSGLWEQAAAQGQTVIVATGDSGPDCDYALGVSVSGLSSTPWNVAVGGTDFYYSDYASGGASATTLWNKTNDGSLGSLKAPLPEQSWDDPFGLDVISDGLARGEIGAGGGGASACSTTNPTTYACMSAYAKPAWQNGTGVPGDGVRDQPDVSLFASNGANLSAIPICAFPGECDATSAQPEILLVGGTSGSAPAMAGIMALVDQKYGRQGQADYTLYQLAQQHPAAFHDVTLGNNNSVCYTGSTDCVVNANGNNVTTVYSAGPGYDLATGLGSVDGNVLVNDWNSIALLSTSTKLTLSSAQIAHGTPVTVTTSVSPSSGSGTPSGAVAILTSSTLPDSQAQAAITLNGGTGSTSVNFFPGGHYNLTANYPGDGVFGSSTSSPVALMVTPENANINFAVLNGETQRAIANGASVQYNVPLSMNIQPIGNSAPTGQTNGNGTGTATFTLDSFSATVPLNGVGAASWIPPAIGIGKHTASATYSGDASFNAASAKAITFTVAKGLPDIYDSIDAPSPPTFFVGVSVNVGGTLSATIRVGPYYGYVRGLNAPLGTAAPTGTVTVCLGDPQQVCLNPSYSQTVTLSSPSGTKSDYATATATFTNIQPGQYGSYYLTALYNGDANWQSQGLLDLDFVNVVSPSSLATTATTLSVTPANISQTGLATFSTTVTGTGSSAPTGEVDFYNNGLFLTYIFFGPNSGTKSSATFQLNTASFWNDGANQITAIYDGDSNYQPSFSNVANVTVAQGGADYTLAPQAPQITLPSGNSGSVGLSLASLSNFSGNVALTCLPSSSQITCSINPPTLALNGSTTATLTINAAAHTGSLPANRHSLSTFALLSSETGFVFGAVLLAGFTDRKRRLTMLLGFVVFGILLVVPGCGGGAGNQVNRQLPPPPAAGTRYSVLVSANGNGVVHSAKVLVLVQ
jgi:hypothetical protein